MVGLLRFVSEQGSGQEGAKEPFHIKSKTRTIMDVLKKMNIEAQQFEARHPKRNNKKTFYIQAKRTLPKQQLLKKLAQSVRGIK